MANYREILRLHSFGTSQRGIAWEVQSSRDTVSDIIKAANAAGITWPLDEDMPSVFRDGESVCFCILILLIIFNIISINLFVTQTFIPFYKMIVKRNPKSDLPE